MAKREPILNQDDKTRIKSTLDQITDVKKELATASQAGLDIKELSDRLNDSESKLSKLYNAYFPT